MALTAIKLKSGARMVFMTVQEEVLIIDAYTADDEFKPIGTAARSEDDRSEEEYHRAFRKAAHEKGDFVPEFSTNPEWNPDYKAEEEP